ncbi:MAG: hypothetical protein U0807_02985 [Candidatus Binatia bacterium]
MTRHGFGALTVAPVALLVLATHARAEDPCRPVTPACTSGADDRLQQAARAFTATESGGLLRGMGLASFTGLLGKKKGKAAEARLDDEFVSQLVSAPVGPANLVSPTASLRGEPRGAGAPAPGIIDVVQEDGHGKIKLHRQLNIEMDVSRCPKQFAPFDRESNEYIAIAATYELVTSWRAGKTSASSGVIIRLHPTDINAAVDQNARFAGLKTSSISGKVSVDRVGGSRRPGKPPTGYSNTVTLDVSPDKVGWDVTVATDNESFDAFISGAPKRPPGREPALISQKAYADLVKGFMVLVDAELMKAIAKAEEVWQRPNACATVVWDPETATAGVPPNAQIRVTGRIVPAGEGLNGLRDDWVPVASIGKIAERVTKGSADGMPLDLKVEGGTPQDGITVKMHYRTPSTIGVVEGDWTAKDGIDHVAGTIQGSIIDGTVSGDSRLDWTGNLAFDRDSPNDLGGANGIFLLASGDYEVTASGIHPPTGCQQRGVQHFVIPAGSNGQFAAQGIGPAFGAPYLYTFFAVIPGPTQTMNVTLFNCPDRSKANEGTVAVIDAPIEPGDNGGATSPDGVDFMDSYTRDTGDGAISASWSFHGS